MAIRPLHKQFWINTDQIAYVDLFHDPKDGDLEKARVFFVGGRELVLQAGDTSRLLALLHEQERETAAV
jgi:hypothetical protein